MHDFREVVIASPWRITVLASSLAGHLSTVTGGLPVFQAKGSSNLPEPELFHSFLLEFQVWKKVTENT